MNSQTTHLVEQDHIRNKILVIRGQQVMIDRDIAAQYGIETRVLNQAVKRNIERFPEDFMFQLTKEECLRSQIVILNTKQGEHLKYLPYAFTENGVAMLSSIIKSKTAIEVNIQIMRAFVEMRKFLLSNAQIFSRLESVEKHQLKADNRIDELFSKMDKYEIDETQGIFFQGQIFDAYAKFESIIKKAKKEIVLIDNYVDISVLERLTKKAKSVKVSIYTAPNTKLTDQDIRKFNEQYPCVEVLFTHKTHDRFLIIDNEILYHVGASLKDLGKKCFAFEILDSSFIGIILSKMKEN